MTSRRPTAAAFAALTAATVLLGACDAGSTESRTSTGSSGPTGPSESESPVSTGPIEMTDLAAGSALEPGTYAMPFVGLDSPMRAVIDVPEGYFSPGGWVVDDGDGSLAPDEFGDLSFWTAIDEVATDPCWGGEPVDSGTTVGDLADALVAQRHRTTTKPVRVTLAGYDGLYLEARGPKDPSRCPGGTVTIFSAQPDQPVWLEEDLPRTVEHLWILNVRGRRVVAVVRIILGKTSHPAELVDMAESVRFTGTWGAPGS